MPRHIPVLLLFDCEPDPRCPAIDDAAPWRGFEVLYPVIERWRGRLAEATGSAVHYNWFWRMDPQVADTYGAPDWAVRTYASEIAAAAAQGDEIGTHPHAWRWDGAWIGDHGNQSWIEHCLRMSFTTFEAAFGRPSRAFRFGDGWISDAALDLAEQLGARYDLTVEPGIPAVASLDPRERSTGSIPDRRGVPTWPYRRSRRNFRRAGGRWDSRLWMIPVSTARPPGAAAEPRGLLARWRRRPTTDQPPLQFNLCYDGATFGHMLDAVLRQHRQPYVAICLRSDAGVYPGAMRNVEANLGRLAATAKSRKLAFATPAEALRLLGCPGGG